MRVSIYKGESLTFEYQTRKEFIDDAKRADAASSSDSYNGGRGVKSFIDACDFTANADGEITIISGKDTITCRKHKIRNHGVVIKNSRI